MELNEWATTKYHGMASDWLTKHLASIPEQESLFRSYLTPRENRQYREGKATMADLLPAVLERVEAKYAREHKGTENRISRACTGPAPETIEVNVQWKRNRTWGMNPHAEVTVRGGGVTEYGSGKASGCGYDKESTAVAEALNQCTMFLNVVLTCARKDEAEGKRTYGYYFDASGVFLDGGVGMNTVEAVLERGGLKLTHRLSGKSYDTYIFDRK